jgi:ankyrin repeat protein
MYSPTHVRLSSSAAIACLLCLAAACAGWSSVQTGGATDLHAVAEGGHVAQVRALLDQGADPNARDAEGRTPLHLAAANGHQATAEALLDGGADINARDADGHTPLDEAIAKGHDGMSAFLKSRGGLASEAALATVHTDEGAPMKPALEFKTLADFEAEIGEPAVLLDGTHVCFFAPKRKAEAAKIVFEYLVRAYTELYKIVGVHTGYKMVVYAFPKGNKHGWGGTSNCSIEYDDTNLDLDAQPEWKQYHKAQFGWEMIGWSLGALVTERVAGNPIHGQQVADTRKRQESTYNRYVNGGYVFPKDLEANQCDRIYAWILWQCEQEYGTQFWPDFFAQARKQKQALSNAGSLGDGDAVRDARYRITVACFDALPRLRFSDRLRAAHISLKTDVKSFHPTDPGWNRRFEESKPPGHQSLGTLSRVPHTRIVTRGVGAYDGGRTR